MSRYCKEKPDVPSKIPEQELGGLRFPPPSEDYSRHKEFTSARVHDHVEQMKEDDFADMASESSDVGEDEPVELGNQLWLDICNEHRTKNERAMNFYEEIKRREEQRHCADAPETQYLRNTLFPVLMRAVEAALYKATDLHLLRRERTAFDPVDIIAELLWNMNPKYPNRPANYQRIFEIEPFVDWLKSHPRPDFPRHFFWTRNQCAMCIQRNFRGYLVRRREDVQQLRKFWKVLKGKQSAPENDPELTYGLDIAAYKELYPDLVKWNDDLKRKNDPPLTETTREGN